MLLNKRYSSPMNTRSRFYMVALKKDISGQTRNMIFPIKFRIVSARNEYVSGATLYESHRNGPIVSRVGRGGGIIACQPYMPGWDLLRMQHQEILNKGQMSKQSAPESSDEREKQDQRRQCLQASDGPIRSRTGRPEPGLRDPGPVC
jgi:hypothetical protein